MSALSDEAGCGMLRALSEDMKVSFINNDRTNEFVVIINRQIVNSDTDKDMNSDTKRSKITNKRGIL